MFNELYMKYFKCFTEQTLTLRPLTILAGLNSSGKSSVLQALRILKERTPLAGHGNFSELTSTNSKNGEMIIKAKMMEFDSPPRGENIPHEFSLSIDSAGAMPRYTVEPAYEGFPALPRILYIAADRIGPQTNLPLRNISDDFENHDDKDLPEYVGTHGEYILDVLNRYRNKSQVPKLLRVNQAKEQELSGLIENINGWLNEISPGLELDISTMEEADVGRLTFAKRRANNVGFGLSYSLPLIASCLLFAAIRSGPFRNKNDQCFIPTLLIENPEAHIHPRGQTIMGKFLAKAASVGIQCIVETHSDHLFDGVRLSVKEGDLSPDNVIAHYFEYDLKKEESEVTPIVIDEHGMCDEWPEGFFDENVKNLMNLV